MKLFVLVALLFTPILYAQETLGAMGSTDITPRKGVPIAGFGGGKRRIIPWDVFNRYKYATYLKPHKGVHDEIRAKAMALQDKGEKVLFLSLDLVGTIDHFLKHLHPRIEELGYKKENIIITSTHTHSGPGALTYNKLWELMAMDRFNKKVYARFIARLVRLIRKVDSDLVPVDLYTHYFAVDGLQRNRAGKAGVFDSEANVLLLKDKTTKRWFGGLINYAIHGTALGMKNLKFSADIPGSIERASEEMLKELNRDNAETTFLLLNGALGDVTPAYGGLEGMEKTGDIFSKKLKDNISDFKKMNAEISIQKENVYLGVPGLSLYNCNKKNFFGKFLGWTRFFKKKRIRFRKSLPKRIDVRTVSIGPVTMMLWPGEPTATLGLMMKEYALERVQYPWTVGLADNHLAYFVTHDEMKNGTKEACTSFYSSKASYRVMDALKKLIDTK